MLHIQFTLSPRYVVYAVHIVPMFVYPIHIIPTLWLVPALQTRWGGGGIYFSFSQRQLLENCGYLNTVYERVTIPDSKPVADWVDFKIWDIVLHHSESIALQLSIKLPSQKYKFSNQIT